MELKNHELINISGGATTISGTLLNAIAKLISTVFDIGRAIGTSISMVKSGKTC